MRLKQELKTAREQEATEDREADENRKKTGEWTKEKEGHNAARMARVHAALLGWIESQLPRGPSAAAIKSSDWEAAVHRQLVRAGMAEKESPPDSGPEPEAFANPRFWNVRVTLDRRPELPDLLFVVAGLGVGCGEDQAVYGYRFDTNGWNRAMSDHPETDWGTSVSSLDLSEAGFNGHRLLVIHRTTVQCASTWVGTNYAVFRVSKNSITPLLAGDHEFWMGNYDNGLIFSLKPEELIIELLDRSLDGGVHNRTQIHRYTFLDGVVKRMEPFALQPQDFAEEWLTRPWSEMRPLSAENTQKWHGRLRAEGIFGEYLSVVPCTSNPDRWSIGFEINTVNLKPLSEPMDVYLLVRDLGNYRYEMEAVSDSAFEGCPGEGSASEAHPWLSREQLKALP